MVERDSVTADVAIATTYIRITTKCLKQNDAISVFNEVTIPCISLHTYYRLAYKETLIKHHHDKNS